MKLTNKTAIEEVCSTMEQSGKNLSEINTVYRYVENGYSITNVFVNHSRTSSWIIIHCEKDTHVATFKFTMP